MPDTVAALLRRHAADPDRLLLVGAEDGVATTYAEQLARSTAVAAGLARRGVRPGDRVHVQLANGREFYDVWFATALGGSVLVPTNPQAAPDETDHVLADARPAISLRTAEDVDALRADGAGATDPLPDVDPGRLAAILYTSGTTSRAKGVMVSDASYVAVGRAVADHLAVTEHDRWLVVLPLFHANAQYYCTMSALVAGASVALAPRFSATGWGRQARRSGATLASLFAAPIRMILAHPAQPGDIDNRVRTVLFAQNVADTDAARFEARFGTRLVQLYGMTETVLPPTMNPADGTGRWDSIGRPLPDVRVELVDGDGNVVDREGELRIAGDHLASGYWDDPEATRAVFTDSGLRTGDLARRDADGFLYFVDRAKDMIKRAGENVSAGEIEHVVAQHPAIAECAAVGIPDPMRDEAVLLVAVLRDGTSVDEEELIAWCRGRLSPFKVPEAVRFVEQLPRTSVGKIRKTELRSLVIN